MQSSSQPKNLLYKLGLTLIMLLVFNSNIFAQPSISGFTPSSGAVGTLVTITGTNLSNTTALTIGGVTAIEISNTGTSLVAMVMPGAVTGTVNVSTAGGSASGGSNFIVTANTVPNFQQGNKLVGTVYSGTPYQGSSISISADGNTAVVGGYRDNSDVGAAWVFVRSGSTWSQQGSKLVGSDATGTSTQGISVNISADGNTIIVGGKGDNSGAGAAWIYTRSGTTWSQQGNKLVGSGAIGNASQGNSVALSADGNTALVGGSGDNNSVGAVWIFVRSSGSWSQQGSKLVGTGYSGLPVAQGISASLSADGNTAVVGGMYDNSSTGAVWVFTRSSGNWSQQGSKLVPSDVTGSANVGYSVDVSADGNSLIMGGPFDDSNIGAAWVFTRSGNTWSQQGNKIIGTGASGTARQGYSVSISANGNTAVIGGPADNFATGSYWIFTRSSNTWSQQGSKVSGTGLSGAAQIGNSIAISADAGTAITGGVGDNSAIGAAWVFVPTPTFTFTAPGNALNFDGINDYVSIPHNANYNLTAFTIETWVYWNPTTSSDIQFICSKGNERLEIHTGATANALRFIPTQGVYLDVTNALRTLTWTHIAFAYDPANTYAKIYIDGVEVPYTISGAPINTAIINNSNAYRFGARLDNTYFLRGSLDEFRLWNTVRTQAEIQNNMFNTLSATSGLVAYYNFDNGTAAGANSGLTFLSDSSSTANNGALNNFNLSGSSSNWVNSTIWNTWTGATNSTYNTASNWHLGSAPLAADNIIIPSSAVNLPITISSAQGFNNAKIQTSAQFLSTTQTLTIGANIYGSGTINATAGTVVYNGKIAQTIPASLFTTNTIQNLTINNSAGVTLGGNLNVTGTLTPTAGILTTGGFLTLKSNASATARVAQGSGAYISGNVTIERYLPPNRRWRPVSVPLKTASGNEYIWNHWQNNGTDGTSNSTGVMLWSPTGNEASNGMIAGGSSANILSYTGGSNGSGSGGYTSVTNTKTTSLFDASGPKPYLLFATAPYGNTNINVAATATTLKATGILNTGTVSYSGLATGYHFIPNPYPSAVTFTTSGNMTATNIADQFWVWDPKVGSGTGGYVTTTAGTSTPQTGSYSGNTRIIPNGSAFFIYSTGSGSLQFTEAAKATSGDFNIFGRTNSTTNEVFRANILKPSAGNILTDGVATIFDVNGTLNIPNGGSEKFNNPAEGIAVRRNNTSYANAVRPAVTNSDTMFLRLLNMQSSNYVLELKGEDIVTMAGITATLKDAYTNTSTILNITGTTNYNFTVDANAASTGDRFMIVFKNNAALPVNYIGITAKNKNVNEVEVSWQIPSEQNINNYLVERSADGRSFTVRGNIISRGNSNLQQTYSFTDAPKLAGTSYYRVKAIDKAGQINYSPTVKVSSDKEQLSVTVYPNPVKDNLNLVIQNAIGGSTVKIINAEGKVVQTQAVSNVNGNILQLYVGALANGTYMVEITDSKGNRVIEKMMKQ